MQDMLNLVVSLSNITNRLRNGVKNIGAGAAFKSKHKTLGPVTCLEYLGIILDSEKMKARFPTVKVERICDFIHKLLNKSSYTKRELLQT
jgi:hypothetical protein